MICNNRIVRKARFQFQIGVIKSQIKWHDQLLNHWFQFQIGVIKSKAKGDTVGWAGMFQFQIGVIKRYKVKKGSKSFTIVSIPDWCD